MPTVTGIGPRKSHDVLVNRLTHRDLATMISHKQYSIIRCAIKTPGTAYAESGDLSLVREFEG